MESNFDLFVKSYWYAVVSIFDHFHGTAIIWKTEKEAWEDINERIDSFLITKMRKSFFIQKK